MSSTIAEALSLRFPPLAIFFAQEAPADAPDVHPQCSMLLIVRAAGGETVAITQGTCGCPGAGEGYGLVPTCPDEFPGGRDCFLRFLSVGNDTWEPGRAVLKTLEESGAPRIMLTEFAEGEGFLKTPELVADYLEQVPVVEAEGSYVVIKPLRALEPGEVPKVVTLLAEPEQLSALLVLANFARPGLDNVRIPFSAGCASLALFPFHEAAQETPRAVIGLTDISARYYLRKPFGRHALSFTMPWDFFLEMEANVQESFLTRYAWTSMMGRRD